MVGPKERLSEEAYEKWYARHKVVEKYRQWVKKLEANPINALPLEERGTPSDTFSLEEMYWHWLGCTCGSCLTPYSKAVKQIRMEQSPIPPAIKSVVNPLPSLPDPFVRHLRDVLEEARSS